MYLEELTQADAKNMTFKQIIEVYNTNFELLKNFLITLGDKYEVEVFSEDTNKVIELSNEYKPNKNNLIVLVNGVYQLLNKDYKEISNKSIELLSDRDYYDEIRIIIIKANLLTTNVEDYINELSELVNNSKESLELSQSLINQGNYLLSEIKDYYDKLEKLINQDSSN